MLHDNLEIFCDRSDKYKQEFARYLKSEDLTENERNTVLQSLCRFLMEPSCTKDVAECFPQYLLLLMSRVIRTNFSKSYIPGGVSKLHRLNCVVIGSLVPINPDVLGFSLHYFESNPAPFASLVDNLAMIPKRRREDDFPFEAREVSTLEIITASYNILEAAPEHFTHKWNWSEFYDFLSNDDDSVKWIALKCIGIVLQMSESTRLSCAKSLLKDPERFLLEQRNENSLAVLTSSKNHLIEMTEVSKDSDSLVAIAGVLLPVFNSKERPKKTNLIPVPSTESNLRSLALAVASRRCICLQGSVGCGKTALVEYLADITGHRNSNFVKVQLGDQTDSKMLLGTYRCTDIPGEFVWQPGVLTQAVINGKWLLLEDIDSAALDVASCLSNLIETGTLSVPGYRDTIYPKSGFQLFLTQRLIPTASGFHRQSTGASNLLEKHWFCVHVDSLTREELVIVVKSLFPPLTTIATRMVDVFLLFSVGHHGNTENITRTGRLTSTRDLIKWCTRAIDNFEVSSPDSALKIFQDAIDIFCCSVSDRNLRLELATAIGHTLGIVKTKAEYFCNTHKPTINLFGEFFQAGRAKVRRKKSSHAQLEQTRVKFSFTRPSATLLERVTSCVAQREPVLLVGETGTGKTSSIQYLAKSTGHKLVVINMNQQSESADLLGGYKPVDFKYLITPTREEFEMLFRSYFALEPNKKFLEHIATCYKQQRWKTLVGLMCHSAGAAVKRLRTNVEEGTKLTKENVARQNKSFETTGRNDHQSKSELLMKWQKLLVKLEKLKSQVKTHFSLAFAFLEGSLIKALHEGHWVLLDEINLASSETLECLSGLLEGATGSLSLLERGDSETIERHPDFTIFACMNPATDVGKKELPIGLRNRFTEFYVDELTERNDLELLVNSYLSDADLTTEKQESIVKFYLNVRKEALLSLNDGTGHRPHYSLRTLCRALSVASANPCANIQRSLYEAFCLSFLTQLDYNSYPIVEKLIGRAILEVKMAKAILSTPIPKPGCGENEDFINFEGYWIVKGNLETEVPKNYILTNSVRRNLRDLVRVVSIGKIPVLLQGDTSVGKTSLITYLAKSSGHTCLRINNHEHTDLQEYVGSYVADGAGRLVFKEGILVEAMRKGHWIILDELNLAPSDVLEALNRVLDDNRELFIPETQQTVKAHPNFMLFATQNPPGLYGGRKVLSRAFRNRFVELHFDEIPADELQIILHERCHMPVSYCKQIINVMIELQTRRKSTAAFQGKHGFITLRDLFRWGERYRLAGDVGEGLYDWSQHLADEGYLVLAAKVRKPEEALEIREVIKKHLKKDVDPSSLFSLHEKTSSVTKYILEEILRGQNNSTFGHVVWTYHMRRMAVLVRKSCQFKEPVLLVGETGGGKTTICQLIAFMSNQSLYSVNCHMHTESSDFLGNLRPVRDHSDSESHKLFEWVDGPLIQAMRKGDLFLADEISLADDSVLERLNSLLEPERSLLLAEKSSDSTDSGESDCIITANEKFQFIGTMNPGGDYGKKELSPALRNRFTEIWCEGCAERSDLQAIVEHNLNANVREKREIISTSMLTFVDWLKNSEVGKRFTVSIRDILTWVNFMNSCTGENQVSKLSLADAYLHGACLTYIDSLGSGLTGMESVEKLETFRNSAVGILKNQVVDAMSEPSGVETALEVDETVDESSRNVFGIAPFFIRKKVDSGNDEQRFTFAAPTTRSNTLKLLRALQLKKPLLLEGSPGVGKTSLVAALAKSSGHRLLRINLSDQTDVSDLFGADLPVEGGKGGEFAWKDGPFLRALRAGDWILLDELNLASQSVLEGLNACLDHRGEIYVPELGRTFTVKPATKLFGCQNPLRQGGARRGLPKSFLNRFTQVYIDALTDDDLKLISSNQFPQIPSRTLEKMVDFNSRLSKEAGTCWAHIGSPWEMNLRDITRWCEVVVAAARSDSTDNEVSFNPGNGVELIYVDRMRTEEDREKVRQVYREIFSIEEFPVSPAQPIAHVTEKKVYFGDVSLTREEYFNGYDHNLLLLRDQIPALKSLARCVQMNWMPILVGAPGCGKSSVVRVLAQLTGQRLRSIVVNSAMDTTEILGGFEQTDYNRHLENLLDQVESLLVEYLKRRLNDNGLKQMVEYHSWLERVQNLSHDENHKVTMAAETELFLRRTKELWKLVTAMKSLVDIPTSELQVIDEQLKKLAHNVKEDKCLNAGGKFEWVDSILVKCLQEGSWLLLDQVNLCSPAVLDRLNGLLEPGGVLTIGERGVANDGDILTIKPHKNFRLFLTMDPRYGEISRAMRNRGVEIFMLGHRERCENDVLDLKSLLHSLGLERSNHQEALLEIHEKISSEDVTSDKLSVVHLLHSAFLINQQISRGFPAFEAFRISCIDVYVKSRCIQGTLAKERLKSLIEEAINRHDVSTCTTNFFDLAAVTPKIRDFQDNSRLTIVRQQGFLLDAALRIHESAVEKYGTNLNLYPTTSLLNEYLKISKIRGPENDFHIVKILPYLLLNFYENSSLNDVQLRERWVGQITSETRDQLSKTVKERSELLAREIAGSKHEFGLDILPWDPTNLPNVMDNVANLDKANRLALILYLIAMNMQYETILDDTCLDKDEKIITVFQYSNSVYHGKLTSHLKNQPLITNFVMFIAQLNSCVNSIFRDDSTVVTSEEYVELRRNLAWLERFYTLGKLPLVDRTEKTSNIYGSLDETILMLRVHYKWLVKFVKSLFALSGKFNLSNESKGEIERLTVMIESINESVKSVDDPFRKIAKRLKKYLVMPLPFSSETGALVYSHVKKLSNELGLCATDRGDSTLKAELKIILLQNDETVKIRTGLMNVWKSFYDDRDSDESVLQILHDTEEFCNRLNLGLRTPVEMSQALAHIQTYRDRDLIDLSIKVQLWPIYEYIFFVLANNFHRKISEDREIETNSRVLEQLSKIPSLPINFVALLKAIVLQENGSKERDRMKHEIFPQLDRFIGRSCAFYDSKNFLRWQGISEMDMEKSITGFETCKVINPIDSPILANLVSELIINKCKTVHEKSILATARLGTYKSRMSQLKTLNEVLWRNSVALNSPDYDRSRNDRLTLLSYLKVFLNAEEKMANERDVGLVLETEMAKQKDNVRMELEEKFKRDYVEPLNELKRKTREISESSEPRDNEHLERAKAWIILGYLQVFLFGNLGHIDPIHKISLKLRYVEEDIEDCRKTIYVASLHSRIRGDFFPSTNTSSRTLETRDRLVSLESERNELKTCKAVRPLSTEFVGLAKETHNFRNSLMSWQAITKIMSKLLHASEQLNTRGTLNSGVISPANDGIQEAEIWQESLQRFAEQLDNKYSSGYPDIVIPFLTAIAQLRHGVRILSDEVKRLINLRTCNENGEAVENLLHNLVRFPTIGNGQSDLLSLVEVCTSPETREIINKSMNNESNGSFVSLCEQFRMVKVGLFELYNRISLEGQLDVTSWHKLNVLLQQIVLIWQSQRDESKKRAAAEDSLYVNKAKIQGSCPTEEEEITRELRTLFPTSRDEDFMDIEESNLPTLERVETNRNDEENKDATSSRYAGLVTDTDVNEVRVIHSQIVNHFVRAAWLRKRVDNIERNYVEPLIQRYNTFSLMLENLLPAMDCRLNTKLYTSLNFLTAVTVRTSEGHADNLRDAMTENGSIIKGRTYDYYKSSNVEEARQCLPILEAIVDRVEGFLKEWPEHPTLGSIKSIIQRIHGFSITSPISRFLTGLELLLVKMKEWEENAHSGVSLSELSLSLTQQIISWRRLELACWKDCLNSAHERLASKASKWWFFLYALVESYATNSSLEVDVPAADETVEVPKSDEPVTSKKLIELLEAFISGSSLVEFQPRLDLLHTFHCHVYHMQRSTERDQLLAIFWNVYNYYKQFSSDVDRKMKSIKAPIEKKLRDFVKIARWNDINYWSVKETVEKTHRTLHKFIREYETGLGISVATCLLIKSSNYSSEGDKGEWDRSKIRDYSIDPQDFAYPGKKVFAQFSNEEMKSLYEANNLIARMENLFVKAKSLSKETILMSSYPSLRSGLEEFMENVISHAVHLKNMDIDRTLPKPKQKAHAKSILQQKKMALADYFKTMSHIGVSYRTGTLAWKNRQNDVIDLTVPPVDLSAPLQRLDHGKVDKQLLAQWEGCENYYYKSLARLNALNLAFTKMQSDLGMPNMERCSGYSNHIMLMAHQQKRLIADSFDSYFSLRSHVANLTNILDSPTNGSGDRECYDCAKNLKKLLTTVGSGLEQLMLYLQACPADPGLDSSTEALTLETSNLAIINATRNDPVWEAANSLLQRSLVSLNPITESYEKLFHVEVTILTPVHYKFLNESNKTLLNVKNCVRDFANVFSNEVEKSHPIVQSVEFLQSIIDEWMEKFLLLEVSDNVSEDVGTSNEDKSGECVSDIEVLITTMLLAIQQKYKEASVDSEVAVPGAEENTTVNVDDENINAKEQGEDAVEEENDMEENSFREKLIESLAKDITSLRLREVHQCLLNSLTITANVDSSSSFKRKTLLARCLPLLKQYLLFSQFYLNEQVGTYRTTCKLLNLQLSVFLDLATNGFCIPKDLDLEEGDGEETKEGKTQNGMGLGDGEGEKDVSDRIETEDQLDEARPADQEKDKQEDKDCKEEENGIDMSEDFEGKMQDIEKDENDENEGKSEDENEEDLDKEMGETEQGADALDEEIWGDDKDESSNENENDKEEDDLGRGEEIGEKEMTAKDDNKKKNEDNERQEDGDRREEEKQEINEMNEPEVNDDQIDPYHGNQQPPPEPEPMDLPDDINLDGEEADDKQQGDEENPFDIDEMKDCMPPPEKEETAEGEDEQDQKEENNEPEDSSDEEDNAVEGGDAKATNEDAAEDEPSETEPENDPKSQVPEKKDEDSQEEENENKPDDGAEEKAAPSIDDPSKELDAADQPEANKDGTRDRTADQPNVDEQQESTAENNQDDSNNRGTGNAQSEQQETGHSGDSMQNIAPVQHRENEKQQIEKRKNPGESDENRSLVDQLQPDKKKMKMIHSREETTEDNPEEEGADSDEDTNDVDMCQHVKSSEKHNDQAMDAATKEQVKQQAANKENEEEKKEDDESMEIEMNVDDEEDLKEEKDIRTEKSAEVPSAGEQEKEKTKNDTKGSNSEDPRIESVVETEGDVAPTTRVDRGAESAFFTNTLEPNILSSIQASSKRMEVENMLSKWTYVPSTDEALAAWNCLSSVVEAPARDLAEKLRLVLEPTQATRLKGDYRTGRRINMRKIIPYIASQFRKDKIWLRRTKPSKRDYQIVLALDDSSSMADNHSKELAFESMSLISKAMGYLEVGELSVISFGETATVLHPLGQPFTENSGSRLIQEMRFDQKKTKVGQLVDFTVDMFDSQKSSNDNAKLLVVLSDGRGVFSEGLDQVNGAVRRARLADIFLVFIIVDNPLNKDSILDIRMPVFEGGKLLGIKSYMDSFPFPFYMILRDINALPGVLSDALRQWFEVVGKIDS
ncbi:midasin [Venturia canescens]|uniref:midasin n=1 Tax=Venturia canescens TaxID=32260 RepID=UPI001C9BBE88|nr:midasin [Venturia canescens]